MWNIITYIPQIEQTVCNTVPGSGSVEMLWSFISFSIWAFKIYVFENISPQKSHVTGPSRSNIGEFLLQQHKLKIN